MISDGSVEFNTRLKSEATSGVARSELYRSVFFGDREIKQDREKNNDRNSKQTVANSRFQLAGFAPPTTVFLLFKLLFGREFLLLGLGKS